MGGLWIKKPITPRRLYIFLACCFVIGVVLICLGLILYLNLPEIGNNQIKKKVTVRKGHPSYEQLEMPTFPFYKDFYFFNLTNAVEFAEQSGGIKPVLKEIGPYSYREHRTKIFNYDTHDVDLISYVQQKIFHFDSSHSLPGVAETDTICTINIPLVAAISEAMYTSTLRFSLNTLIKNSAAKLYICKEAGALAWNYTDSFLHLLHESHHYPIETFHLQLNNSIGDNQPSTIHTGIKDISNIGKLVLWDGQTKLQAWPNGDVTGANDIRGTEGFFFKPLLKKGNGLTIFVDDYLRSIDLVYEEDVKIFGVTAFQYGIDNLTIKSAFSEPQNSQWNSWCPDGMFYLGPTQTKEMPIFGSKPHFLDCDPLLLDSVVGLKPNRSKHDTVFFVEPKTGTTLSFARQLQINVQVNRTVKFPFYEHPINETVRIVGYNGTGTLYYPVAYVNEYTIVDDEVKQRLDESGLNEVQMLTVATPAILGVLVFLGVVSLLTFTVTFANFMYKSRKHNSLRTPLLIQQHCHYVKYN